MRERREAMFVGVGCVAERALRVCVSVCVCVCLRVCVCVCARESERERGATLCAWEWGVLQRGC